MAETRTINLEIKDNVKSLKTQYREAVQEVQKMSSAYGETSAQAIKAAKAAAELKDQIEFSNDLIKGFNPDEKFQAVEGAISGVMNGFQAFEGGLALIGVESEDLQKTMVKLQGVMALTQGVNGVLAAKDSFVKLGAVVKSTFSAMTTAGKAFAVTGIGLLVTGIGLLIANWDKLTGKEKFNYEQFKQTQAQKLELLKAQQNALDRQYNAISKGSDETLKGIDLEIEKANLLGKNTDALYKRKSELIQKTATETIKATEDERQAIKDRYSELQSVQGTLLENTKFYLEQKAKLDSDNFKNEAEKRRASIDVARYEEAKALRERAYELKAFRENEFDRAENAESELALMKLQKQKEASDKAKAARDADLSELRGYIKEANKLYSQSQMDDTEKAIDEIKRKYERQLKLAKKYNKGIAEIEIAMMNEINDIRLAKVNEQIEQENAAREQARLNRIRQENELFAQIEGIAEQNYQRTLTEQEKEILAVNDKYFELETLAQGNADALNEIELAKLNELNDINLKYDAEEKARKDAADAAEKQRIKQLNEYRVQAVKDGLQTISNLAELFAGKSEKQQKRAFQVQKAVNIANAVIDTYKAANTALASSPPPFNYIAMAAAITAGLVNVKKIASQQFQSSSSSSGGGGGTPSAPEVAQAAPQFNTIGSSGINQLAQLQQQPVQAYVVSGEVTSAQALDRNRIQNATL